MYSLLDFGNMATDGVRMDAYARAIARSVKPGSVVVDIGAGSGIFTLLALRAGARHVHAIDMNPAIWALKDLAAENKVSERVTIHATSSHEVTLDERADVVIADLRGSIPLYEGNLATLLDAKKRLLAPGGTLLPTRDELFVAMVENERVWADLERGWSGFEARGFSAKAVRNSVLNLAYSDDGRPIAANHVVSDAQPWAEVTYGEEHAPVCERTVTLTATREATVHALALWFEATIAEGIGYSTAPGTTMVYKRMLLPLLEPVRVAHGDVAKVAVRIDVTGERWGWDTEIGGKRFRQSTFLGKPTSVEALLRETSAHVPTRSPRGDRARRALDLMDGTHTVQQIADALGATLDEARELVRRYAV